MSLLNSRTYYKPFKYPWAFEAFVTQQKMHWIPEEVPMHSDVNDWNHKLSPEEKSLLTQIFRFFTQGDIDVANGYYDKYIPIFGGHPEVKMMLGAFAGMEGVHVHAYSTLLDTLGLPETEYQAFAEYKEMADKHDYIEKFDSSYTSDGYFDKQAIAKTLAVYSAFTEGMQLFSSFVILLNFTRFGKMKGMGQIVTWSIRDESLHVESMIKLFREFCKENPELVTDDFKKDIYDICRKMVELEDSFIDLAFAQGGIEGLTADEVKTYIRYIADRRLISLGLKGNYKQKTNPLEWVDYIVNGVEHANFFETKATAYSKGSLEGSWDEVWRKAT